MSGFASGWLATYAFNFSGSGMPVFGSGFDASMASLKDAGEPAAKIGTLIMGMCCKPPPARRNSRAMPRGAGAASGTSGLPPPNEKRATKGMAFPVNSGERLSGAAAAVPTNSPAAQVPLMWFLRWPGCTPKVPSKDSIICWGVIDGAAAGVAVCAPANIEAVETVADARVRNTNRVPRRTIDDFIKGHSRVAKRWRARGWRRGHRFEGSYSNLDREPLIETMQSSVVATCAQHDCPIVWRTSADSEGAPASRQCQHRHGRLGRTAAC